MGINTERLKTDAAYWRECGAPEDAQWFGFSIGHFYKQESGRWFYSGGRIANTWQRCSMGAPLDDNLIPRPQAPRPEWVDGLPGVGVECEVRMNGDQWAEARVIGHDGEGGIPAAVCRVSDSYYAFSRKCIRPIPTPEQRQRGELECLIESAYAINGVKGVADAMESSYSLEPKP